MNSSYHRTHFSRTRQAADSDHRGKRPAYGTVLLVLTLLFTVGCSTLPTTARDNPEEFSTVSDPTARRLLRGGHFEEASARYVRLAEQSGDPVTRQENLVIAAEILYDRGLHEPGLQRLQAIGTVLSTPELQHRYLILEAKHRLFNNDPEAALQQLPEAEQVTSPIHRARLHEVQAQAWHQLQQPGLELIARIALERQLDNPAIIDQNHAQIWRLLNAQPASTLRELTTDVQDATYQGWLELALINASMPTNDPAYVPAISQWQHQFPVHPANERFLTTLFAGEPLLPDNSIATNAPINQIGVLLPFSAPGYQAAAEAIRDGLVVAYQHDLDRANPPLVKFYDSGGSPALVRSIYQQALDDGADAIIGPLLKDSVTAIVTMRQIPRPTLTLNYVDTGFGTLPSNLIQFGLSPEDEARAVAKRLLAQGLRQAVVLQSDDSRGDRESRAFHEEMLLHGADVVYAAVLPTDTYDFSRQIRDALLISQSDRRFKQLGQVVPGRIHFEPSIRDDLDAVFLAMGSEQAQSVRPQLAFYRASHVPMLGTSRVMTSIDDKRSRKDLNGIQFPDTPWTLDPAIRNHPIYRDITRNFPDATGVFARLYALGVDAYQIMNNLGRFQQEAGFGQGDQTQYQARGSSDTLATLANPTVPGFTGDLWLDHQNRVHRNLRWGQYRLGTVETIKESTPVSDSH